MKADEVDEKKEQVSEKSVDATARRGQKVLS